MQDKTVIRLAQLICGAFALFIHAQYGINSLIVLMIAVLWGIPLDIIITKATKNNHEKQIKIITENPETKKHE